jgi:8-oxo-dGTP pyrophosphatase MutT (NUDIX family)
MIYIKSTPYIIKNEISNQPNTGQMRVINKAFSSLSFRGKRGYSMNVMRYTEDNKCKGVIKQKSPNWEKHPERSSTYGGILCIKNEEGENLYALVQGRYTGKWSFPKGHSNEGEHPFECTLREVYEETGIDKLPDPIDNLQVGYGNYFVFNLTEPIPLIPRDTNEIMATKWVTLEEMERMSLNADASQYRKKLKSVAI